MLKLIFQVILIGAGGCGKNTLIKKVAKDCNSILYTLDATEICRPEPGETEALLKKKFQEAILLSQEIDEGIYLLNAMVFVIFDV
jgi:SpoVK/Ycf46/Vps4 family AAA+-type ATPase